MRRYIYRLSLMMVLLPGVLQAQEPMALSLEDAMNYAVKNNVKVKNAELDMLIQQAVNAEVTGLALPNIKATGEFMDYINPIQSFVPGEFIGQPGKFVAVPFTPKFTNTASVTGSQLLFDGSVLVALQARNAILKLTEQNKQLTEEEIRYNVQKAYYSFVVAQRQYGILKDALASARSMARDVQGLYNEGFIEKIEIDRTTVQINNLATDSLRIGNLIQVSEQLLKYQMGMSIDQPVVLTDTSVENKLNDAQDLLNTQLSYTNRTEFNLLQSQLKLNEYDLKRHKLSAVPSLAAFGTAAYNYATNDFNDLFGEQYIFYSLVGLRLNVPIFDGLQRRNRVKQAKFAVEKTMNNIELAQLSFDFEEKTAKTTLRNNLLMLQSQDRNLELARSVVDLAQRKYKEGVGSNMEVTQAQTELLNAQNNYFQAMLDVITAKSDLQKALGQFK